MSENEVVLDGSDHDLATRLIAAIDKASDQNKSAWVVTAAGRRIAAIVPVDVAEDHERQIEEVLRTPVGTMATKGTWVEVPDCPYLGHAQHEVSGLIERPTAEPHAHWVGDREQGHQMFMAASKDQAAKHQEKLEALARSGLLSRRRR